MRRIVIERGLVRSRILTEKKRPLKIIRDEFSYYKKGFQHSNAFKANMWDGKTRLLTDTQRFPAGLTDRAVKLLQNDGYDVQVLDRRPRRPVVNLKPLNLRGINPNDKRTPIQVGVIDDAIAKEGGVIDVATGVGKTEIIAGIAQRFDLPALVFVSKRDNLKQTRERLAMRLSVPLNEIGAFGDGKHFEGRTTVAMFQSMRARLQAEQKSGGNEIRELLKRFPVMMIDECHHTQAKTFYYVTNRCLAYFRYGFSGTPFKSKGDREAELKLVGATGEIVRSFRTEEAVAAGVLVRPYITMLNWFGAEPRSRWEPWEFAIDDSNLEYHQLYSAAIVGQPIRGVDHKWGQERNQAVVASAQSLIADNRPTLVLVERIEHGETLSRKISKTLDDDVPFVHGQGWSTRRRAAALQALAKRKIPAIVATPIWDESVDAPSIAGIVLAGAGKAAHRNVQRIGRGTRPEAGKTHLEVIDFFDTHSRVLWNQSKQRLKDYRENGGYEVEVV